MQTPPVHFGQLKFIPVRGRKRELLILKAVFAVLKFIPVRGRKLTAQSVAQHDVLVEIYPREGTETIQSSASADTEYPALKIIPVRGRKLFARLLSGDLVSGLKFIPVRGRKLQIHN